MIFKIFCPAKLNLYLAVNGKTFDGYHDLTMLMQTISLFDHLNIEVIGDGKKEIIIDSNMKFLPRDNKNLVYKVISFFQKEYNISDSMKVYIKKIIPMGAGMGGGSTDAASMIKFMNRYYHLELGYEKLIDIANIFGSDIPFFIKGGLAECTGRGENIKPLKRFAYYFIVTMTPKKFVSTKEVFTKYDEMENIISEEQKNKHYHSILNGISSGDYNLFSQNLYNDLEIVTKTFIPEIEIYKKALLDKGADFVLMSGSGGTVYGIFRHCVSSLKAKAELKREYTDAFLFLSKPI